MKSSNNLIIQGGMLMLSMSGKERIAIEVGSHWTKVIVGASLGKKKKNVYPIRGRMLGSSVQRVTLKFAVWLRGFEL